MIILNSRSGQRIVLGTTAEDTIVEALDLLRAKEKDDVRKNYIKTLSEQIRA